VNVSPLRRPAALLLSCALLLAMGCAGDPVVTATSTAAITAEATRSAAPTAAATLPGTPTAVLTPLGGVPTSSATITAPSTAPANAASATPTVAATRPPDFPTGPTPGGGPPTWTPTASQYAESLLAKLRSGGEDILFRLETALGADPCAGGSCAFPQDFATNMQTALMGCEQLGLRPITTLPYYDLSTHGLTAVPLTSACGRIEALAERDFPGTRAAFQRHPIPDTLEWRAAATASRDELLAIVPRLRPRQFR
jgi:hypothetical protein